MTGGGTGRVDFARGVSLFKEDGRNSAPHDGRVICRLLLLSADREKNPRINNRFLFFDFPMTNK